MENEATPQPAPERDRNEDPITGEPGSHPVGTGVGAAAGGASGAAIGAAGGPVGAAVGAVIGAIAGGYAGKGVAEAIDPTAEDAYWREHHGNQPYADKERDYDDYMAAYRAGYTGYRRGQTFEEREADLKLQYENGPQNREESKVRVGHVPDPEPTSEGTPLEWNKAREAARAAYERVHRGSTIKD